MTEKPNTEFGNIINRSVCKWGEHWFIYDKYGQNIGCRICGLIPYEQE